LRGLLNQFVPDSHPFTTVFIATAFSVWYAGLWPSMLTAAVGWLGAKCLFVPLLYSLRIATREERNSAIAYFLISFATILFGGLSQRTITKQRRAQARLLTVQEELEERIRQRTVLLEVTNESLRHLSARLLKVRDEEQRRLARHLHDSTGQTLAVLAMNLHRLEGEARKLSAGLAKTRPKARHWLKKFQTACAPFPIFFTLRCWKKQGSRVLSDGTPRDLRKGAVSKSIWKCLPISNGSHRT